MRNRAPMTEKINASEARQQWSELLNKVFRNETRVVVEKSGIPVAALVSTDDLARLNRLDQQRREDFAVIDELRAAFQGVPAEEIEAEADRAIATSRAQRSGDGVE